MDGTTQQEGLSQLPSCSSSLPPPSPSPSIPWSTWLGVFYLTLVVVLWVVSAFLIQFLLSSSPSYISCSPVCLTLWQTSTSILFLIPWSLKCFCSRFTTTATTDYQEQEEGAFELLKRAIPIAILWFSSELSYNISLAFTSVPTSNILASTSTLFTFVFSLWSRQIAFSFLTVINLLVLFIGLSVVLLSKPTSYVSIRSAHTGLSLSQITSSSLSHLSSPTLYSSSPTLYSSSPTPHISPSSLTVVGSAVPTDTSYGAWTAVLSALLCSLLSLVASSNLPQQERRVQDEGEVRGSVRELLMETTSGGSQTTGRTRKVDSTKVFGLVGLLIILFSPVVILLTPVLSSEVPSLPSSTALLFLLANGLLGTSLPDLLWLRSVSLLSPLTSTAALTLSVPTSQFADIFLLHNHSFSASYLLGSALALAAVICLIFRHNRGTNRS
eukprot:GHVS01015597.1.p1 GENE.GHVS01015597.1~~GHVS01015597.1.p1  ORF type:complete len:440 (-),score=80.84 GHVS01015597.1:178-1497(-)